MASATRIRHAAFPDDRAAVHGLFSEYAGSIGVDLSFQGFQQELANLPGDYAQPDGAVLLLEKSGAAAGCVAVRPYGDEAARIAEMKRLYVRDSARGIGAGRRLALSAMEVARDAGYVAIRLDTMPDMTSAIALYDALGFEEQANDESAGILLRVFEKRL